LWSNEGTSSHRAFPMPSSRSAPLRTSSGLPAPVWIGLLTLAALAAGLTLVWLAFPGNTSPTRPLPLRIGLTLAGAALLLAPGALLLAVLHRFDAARQRWAAASEQDAVTGLATRRHFLQQAEREWSRCRRYGEDAAVLLIDADRLPELLQAHGPRCAEMLLREVARVPAQSLRTSDLAGRFDAARLVVLLPHTDLLGALDVAERIRERVAGALLRWQREALGTTVSVGVAAAGAGHATLDALLRDAEAALGVAQQAGGNCLRAAPLQPRPLLPGGGRPGSQPGPQSGPGPGDRRARRG